MRITPLTPTHGPQAMDDDRDEELELAELVQPDDAPIESAEASADTSDEGADPREGFARLFDFLQAKAAQKALEKGPLSKEKVAHRSYQKVSEGHIQVSGHYISKRA